MRATLGRSTTSIRLDDELRRQLAAQAAAETTTVTELIERYAREGLVCAAQPGIVFKPGPAGRRAALAGGPDVWEIVAALRHTTGTESERMVALAEQFGIHERQVTIALSYAAAHREEIEARIDANDQALARAERRRRAPAPAQLGAHNLPDGGLVALAAAGDRVIVTGNASDFAAVTACPVLLVSKAWWPAASLPTLLAGALDRWATAPPTPGAGHTGFPLSFARTL